MGLSLIALLLKQVGQLNLQGLAMLASVAAVVSIVWLAAPLALMRSGVEIQPAEALKSE